jgi:hypothetical protein
MDELYLFLIATGHDCYQTTSYVHYSQQQNWSARTDRTRGYVVVVVPKDLVIPCPTLPDVAQAILEHA